MSRLSPRVVSAALLVAGAVVGTHADRIPSRQPVRAGEYWVLSGDFHVHAFPGDGALAPWMLRDEAARAGLDVIAVTNHNQTLTGRLAEWISGSGDGPLMLTGQEVTNPEYHMVAAGLQHAVNADQPAAGAIVDVHAQGGVAIAAHPSRRFRGYDSDATVAALDGAEAAHSGIHVDGAFRRDLNAFFERARRINPGVAAIGSSDFHAMPPPLGLTRTFVFVRERTKAGVLDAIRSGRTLAVDGDGRLTGDPSLIRLLGDVRPAGRSDPHPKWRRVSVALTWFGALGLVILSGRVRAD
ncbi:MAG: CehA/McbA family metallohydrolase [Vicinamibacterales bacterium]